MSVTARGRLLIPFSLLLLLAAGAPAGHAGHDPAPGAPEWVDATYRFEVADDLRSVNLTGLAHIHQAGASAETRPFCTVSCTADDLRFLYQRAGDDQGAFVEALEDAIEARAAGALARVAGTDEDVVVSANVDETTLATAATGDPYHPPIDVDLVGFAPIGLIEASRYDEAQLRSILAMGTRLRVPLADTVAPGNNLTMTLAVREPLALLDGDGGALTEGDRAVTWIVSNWESATAARLDKAVVVGRPDVRVPPEASGELVITLDLSDVSANYANLFSGSEIVNVGVALTVDGTYEAVRNEIDLGDGAELPVLSADALRIGLDSGVVDRDQLTDIERSARESLVRAMRASFDDASPVEGGFLNESLNVSGVGAPPGSGPPIVLHMETRGKTALPPAEPAGSSLSAFTIMTVPLGDELSVPDIPGDGTETIVLRIVLPPGTDLQYTSVTGGTIAVEQVHGDKAYVLTGTTPGEPPRIEGASLVIAHPLIVHVFWPLLFLAGLLVAGIVFGIVMLIARSRRKRQVDLRTIKTEPQQTSATDPAEDRPVSFAPPSSTRPRP